jgi:hypothetical protein
MQAGAARRARPYCGRWETLKRKNRRAAPLFALAGVEIFELRPPCELLAHFVVAPIYGEGSVPAARVEFSEG